MKSQVIILLVLAVVAHCLPSSVKSRRYEKENPSKARMFHKKGGGGGGGVQVLLLETPAAYPAYDYYDSPEEEIIDFTQIGEGTFEQVDDTDTTRAHFADNNEDDDDDEDFIEVDNEQTSKRGNKRNSNLKLKKQTGKKEAQKKMASSAASKKGANKIRFIQLSDKDNNKVHSNSDNIVLRRLRVQ
ncbi:uncharacterized protein LOC129944093 [Eupeodes corollae]|uniref:uncharacterized protein LOC129944093 n=1 Tax=Eupeodes corollae TaxID=290404 RepID=UPI002492C0E2|nr:uncharacterized protein LOC129944093 [Eupeodes corollae]